MVRRALWTGRLPVAGRLAAVLLPLALVLAVPAPACGGGKAGSPEGMGVAATVPPVREGLLIARAEGLVLRSMADGAERTIKPAAPATVYTYPRWSPDGSRIAYVVTTYPTRTDQRDWGSRIIVLDLDSGDERVAFDPAATGVRVEGIAWSPDGRSLYLSTIDQAIGASLKLERLDLAGGSRAIVIEGGAYPTVAPDGRIAYVTFSSGLQGGGLWIANADGSDRRLLLSIPGAFAGVRQPRISPDGRQIAFGAVEAANADAPAPTCTAGQRRPWEPRVAAAHGPPISLWTVPIDGGPPRRASALVEDDPAVAWSPDGATLAAIGLCGLYEIAMADGDPRKLGPGAYLSQIDWR